VTPLMPGPHPRPGYRWHWCRSDPSSTTEAVAGRAVAEIDVDVTPVGGCQGPEAALETTFRLNQPEAPKCVFLLALAHDAHLEGGTRTGSAR